MRWTSVVAASAVLLAAAPAARAQESDEEVKRRIMERVRERLQLEKQRILEVMSKVIDEELADAPKKDAPPAAPEPKAVDKRIRDLERKLQALDDQRDDLLRDIRAIRRETEDARIIASAKDSPPETLRDANDEFQESFSRHEEQDFDDSIHGFKRLYYSLKDHANKELVGDFVKSSAYNVACGYALQGKATEAIDWLELAIQNGYSDYDHIRKDSDFESIRKERRYLRLLADR